MAMRQAFRSTRVARLDWAALSSKVTSDAGKAELGALRATYSGMCLATHANTFITTLKRHPPGKVPICSRWRRAFASA